MANTLIQMDYLNNRNLAVYYNKKDKYYQYMTVATFTRNRLEKNGVYTLEIKNNTSEAFGFYVCENCFQGGGNVRITVPSNSTVKIAIKGVNTPWNWDDALIKSTKSQTVLGNFEIRLVRGDYTNRDIPDYILPIT